MPLNCPEIQVVKSAGEFNRLYPELEIYLRSEKDSLVSRHVCRLFLVRHGESEANVTGCVAGRTLDVDLTEKGCKQSEAVGHFFSEFIEDFTLVYTSPSKRTVRTADLINQIWSGKRVVELRKTISDERLLEKFYGRLEGMAAEEYEPYRQKHEQDLKTLTSFADKFCYKVVENMESLADIHARVIPLLKEVAKQHLGDNILMTTHNGIMKALFIADAAYKKSADVEYQSFHLGNTSILMIESDGDEVSIRAIRGLKFKHE